MEKTFTKLLFFFCSKTFSLVVFDDVTVDCIYRVKTNSAFLYKRGHKSSQIKLKVTPDNRKISFHSLIIAVFNTKIIPPLAALTFIHKNERLLHNLSCPESKYPYSFTDL